MKCNVLRIYILNLFCLFLKSILFTFPFLFPLKIQSFHFPNTSSLPFLSLPFSLLPFPFLSFPSLPFSLLPFHSLFSPSLPFTSLPFPFLSFPSLPFRCLNKILFSLFPSQELIAIQERDLILSPQGQLKNRHFKK